METQLSSRCAETRIRQLCGLALDSQLIIPAVLREVHSMVPSRINVFFWVDEHRKISNIYTEAPEAVGFAAFCSREFDKFRSSGVERDRRRGNVPENDDLSLSSEVQHRQRTLGLITLYRAKGDAHFTAQDQWRLNGIAPHVALALTMASTVQAPLVECDESGVCVTDREGKLKQCSTQARKLLYLAAHPRLCP